MYLREEEKNTSHRNKPPTKQKRFEGGGGSEKLSKAQFSASPWILKSEIRWEIICCNNLECRFLEEKSF